MRPEMESRMGENRAPGEGLSPAVAHSTVVRGRLHPPYAWVIFGIAFTGLVVGWGAWHSFGVFLNSLLKEFGWTRAATTGCTVLFHLFHGSFSVILGRMVDKQGPRRIIPAFGILMGIGYILLSQTSNIWHLYVIFGLIIGTGSAVVYVPFISVVGRWFREQQGKVMGILVCATGVGVIIQPVAEILIHRLGWRNAYIVLGVVICLVMGVAGILLRLPGEQEVPGADNADNAKGPGSGRDPDAERLSYSVILKLGSTWILFFTYLSDAFCVLLVSSHMVVHAVDQGIPSHVAVYLLSVMGGTSIFGRLVVGTMSDRFGRRIPLVVTLALIGFSLAFLPFIHGLPGLVIFSVFFGFAWGGYVPLVPAAIGEIFGQNNVGSVLGICVLGASVGAAIGPVLGGYVFDVSGSYRVAFWLGAALAWAAAGASWRLRAVPLGRRVS